MRMQFAPIFLVKVLLCLQILSLCNGAPPKRVQDGEQSFSARFRYTEQERNFIVNELLSLPSNYMEASETSIWKILEKKMQDLRKANTPGFPQDRTDYSIRKFFKYTLEDNAEFMAALPERLRQDLSDLQRKKITAGKRPYSYEEDKFLIDYLSSIPDKSRAAWTKLAREFRAKRGSPGFYEERTPIGLRLHFNCVLLRDPNGRVKVPASLRRKFGAGGSSSSSASQSQETDFQEIIEEMLNAPISDEEQDFNNQVSIPEPDDRDLDSWIEELESAPVELDFSKLDKPTN